MNNAQCGISNVESQMWNLESGIWNLSATCCGHRFQIPRLLKEQCNRTQQDLHAACFHVSICDTFHRDSWQCKMTVCACDVCVYAFHPCMTANHCATHVCVVHQVGGTERALTTDNVCVRQIPNCCIMANGLSLCGGDTERRTVPSD